LQVWRALSAASSLLLSFFFFHVSNTDAHPNPNKQQIIITTTSSPSFTHTFTLTRPRPNVGPLHSHHITFPFPLSWRKSAIIMTSRGGARDGVILVCGRGEPNQVIAELAEK
jgi:hypothetical protein